jgi:hypothetical protein
MRKVEEQPVSKVLVPLFNSDSAFQYVSSQVSYGPRVPGTNAHEQTKDYLISHLKKCGASISTQEFDANTFDNHKVKLTNIIASFKPELSKRILLAAHWDTRPFADKDLNQRDAPFDGANDGASGVGVLMEIARAIGDYDLPDFGIDIILFDGEDWGEKDQQNNVPELPDGLDSWWCLGSQYWAKNKHVKNYSASYGILLDMVGARSSQFYREGISMEYAPKIVNNVWNAAAKIGYSDYFVKQNVGAITDDHVFVNQYGKIPTIDIVHYQAGIGFFGDYHHTQKDNLDLISKEILKAVGSTLLYVVYNEDF